MNATVQSLLWVEDRERQRMGSFVASNWTMRLTWSLTLCASLCFSIIGM